MKGQLEGASMQFNADWTWLIYFVTDLFCGVKNKSMTEKALHSQYWNEDKEHLIKITIDLDNNE